MKKVLLLFICLSLLISCNHDKETKVFPDDDGPLILDQLANNYEQLPEKQIAQDLNRNTYAQYAIPTEIYGHGVLGDKIEAQQLVVVVDGAFYQHTLPNDYVFEDIRPRLYDVDGDSELEFITIRANIFQGAGIAIYKIIDEKLVEYAYVPEIGTPNRWLNIVTIADLDNDGLVEIVWIETPHIGGILKVAKINSGALQVLAQKAQYSNHGIGERNLCLSVLTSQSNTKPFYVPSQSRDKIVGFTFSNNEFFDFEEIPQAIDFSKTLASQYSFRDVIEDEDNCIIVN